MTVSVRFPLQINSLKSLLKYKTVNFFLFVMSCERSLLKNFSQASPLAEAFSGGKLAEFYSHLQECTDTVAERGVTVYCVFLPQVRDVNSTIMDRHVLIITNSSNYGVESSLLEKHYYIIIMCCSRFSKLVYRNLINTVKQKTLPHTCLH